MDISLGRYSNLLGSYLRPQRGRVVLLSVLLIGGIGLQLGGPQVVRAFIDATQSGASQGVLLATAALFIAIAAIQRIIAVTTLYMGETVGWGATNALRADLLRHVLRLDMSFHKRRTPGELIERINGDVEALANFFSQFTVRVLGNALLAAGILLLLFREDWRVGLGLTLYTIITLATLLLIQRLSVRRWAATRQASAEQYGFLEERIAGTEDIRASGAEQHVVRRFVELMRRFYRAEVAAFMVSNLGFVITNFLFLIGYALGLAIGAYLYIQGQVSIGTAFMVVFYIGMLSTPLENIREQAEDLQRASASIDRVGELLRIQPRVHEVAQPQALAEGALAVEFAQVAFAYNDDDPPNEPAHAPEQSVGTSPAVLQDISFCLEPGMVLGLLGRTGSGKTTLSRLLFRLYDPTAGAIRLAGIDLREMALADLRARVGMVTQDVQLFQASVRENVALFNAAIDDASIEQALRQLELWEWVQSLPQGLDMPLGAGGLGLSAGEAQLLAFARILLRNPGLVILDEASSRLDPATGRLLERAVSKLLEGRTAIIIAHRLATVQRADAIMILEAGRMAEYGNREALARNSESRFARLLRTGVEEVLV